MLFWVGHGVKIFRVDNPHTKPFPFWQWLIREVNDRHPDVIFLAEAFTRPKVMKQAREDRLPAVLHLLHLAQHEAGAHRVRHRAARARWREYYRPNFFANTPDINPYYLQTSGRPGFIVRGTLAATLSSV